METKKFEFPKRLLDQINECSTSFFLVTTNENGEFSVFQNTPSPVQHLAMINFLEIFSTRMQANMRDEPENGLVEGD